MTRTLKRSILMLVDAMMILLAALTSIFFLRAWARFSIQQVAATIGIFILVYMGVAICLKVFSILTRYTDAKTLTKIALSLLVASLVALIYSAIWAPVFSYRFVFLTFIFSFLSTITPRIIWRTINESKLRSKQKQGQAVSTLVVGAGAGGSLFISTVEDRVTDIVIKAVIDDAPEKKNTYIHGHRIVGNREDIPKIVKELEIQQVTLAIPSLSGEEREKIVDICRTAGVTVNTMPSIEDTLIGKVSTGNLKEIDISDLLGREEVLLDQTELGIYFADKTVLVTGAGGSIGSEICRQLMKFVPKRLLLLGHGENSIYLIHRELTEKYGSSVMVIPLIADIQDREVLVEIMSHYAPDVVYHAAAHKHVPLMEYNPKEAVKNNILGTKNVAEAAKAAGVEKFVMVSTDKAVNPPNVMGATKRVAEMIVTNLNEEEGTQFVAVRFGNVLGSRGSVVPVFKEQVAKGGPVTVTDFRMTRYFMTIPEASRLVIQAGYLAHGGEIFVLDMGEPVRIVDLARKVIKLSGHKEEDIGIIESGIRPGEKLYEELLSAEERITDQVHEKIFVGRVKNKDTAEVQFFIDNLSDLTNEELREALINFAKQE